MSWPTIHGKRKSRVYAAWVNMRGRCERPSDKRFDRYGGRGIRVCERWQDFRNFYADMGDPPPGMTLDRIDNDGNYEPGNCRWASVKEQALNRSDRRLVTVDGETMNVTTAAERYGTHKHTIKKRLDAGWTDDDAVKKPDARFGPKRRAKPAQCDVVDGVEIRGERMSLYAAVKRFAAPGVSYSRAYRRITQLGWNAEKALVEPPAQRHLSDADCREAVAMAVSGLAHRAIAARLGVTSPTISRLLRRVHSEARK